MTLGSKDLGHRKACSVTWLQASIFDHISSLERVQKCLRLMDRTAGTASVSLRAATSTGVLPKVWNQKARYNLADRPMFCDWMKYVESLPESADEVDPEQVRDAALEHFGKKAAVQKTNEELDLRRKVKLKFNSQLAMKWTDGQVTGKPLGALTASFKIIYPST